jgi:rsbT antagonist protein RsbS
VARVPIVRIGKILVATVQEELYDRDALRLQEDLTTGLEKWGAKGVLIDLSTVQTVDSFLGRLLNDVATSARLMGAATIVVGIQPAVAITLVELGLELHGVRTALTADKGFALLHRQLSDTQ